MPDPSSRLGGEEASRPSPPFADYPGRVFYRPSGPRREIRIYTGRFIPSSTLFYDNVFTDTPRTGWFGFAVQQGPILYHVLRAAPVLLPTPSPNTFLEEGIPAQFWGKSSVMPSSRKDRSLERLNWTVPVAAQREAHNTNTAWALMPVLQTQCTYPAVLRLFADLSCMLWVRILPNRLETQKGEKDEKPSPNGDSLNSL